MSAIGKEVKYPVILYMQYGMSSDDSLVATEVWQSVSKALE